MDRESRDEKEVLALLDAPETAEEQAALDALPRDVDRLLAQAQLRAGPGALRLRKERHPWIGVAIATAAAAALVVAYLRAPVDPVRSLRSLQGEARPLEVAIADLPYAPYQPSRGAREGAKFDQALRQLLEAREKQQHGAERSLAMLYLLRGEPGDAARADALLAQAGGAPEAENDRGVALFARGELISALERFLRAGALPAAQFNRALALEKLGLRERAAQAFEGVSDEAWKGEAAQRARALREPLPAPGPSRRLEVMRELLAAGSEAELAHAQQDAAQMPDLLALSRKLDPRRIERHAALYQVYKQLRGRAVTGTAPPAEVDDFARLAEVQADPLLWSASLQLAGYLHAARGDWRAAQPYEASVAGACKVRGCAVEVEAIALDELADMAAQDGDYPLARRLQERAEALFTGVGAAPQLAELARKRAAMLEEQDRVEEAAAAAQTALQELSRGGTPAQQAAALEQAQDIAVRLGWHRAAQELGEAALEQARAADARDLSADIVGRLATASMALGDAGQARARLTAEIDRLTQAGHAALAARLRARLSATLLSSGEAAAALAEAERGLGAAEATWESTRVMLHSAHARALAALGRAPEASVELWVSLDELAKSIAGAPESAPLPEAAEDLVAQLAATATTADELALPLDRLRAAALHVPAAQAGWSRALGAGECVLVLAPSAKGALQGIATREGGAVRAVAADAPASGTEKCALLWLFAEPPFDKVAQAGGVATSLTRLLAAEPAGAPKRALLVSAQTTGDVAAVATALPGASDEAAALRATGAEVSELSGERATPAHALEAAADEPFLHFAVHGFGGAFLQLAGEGGRLASRDIARARLQPGARVVLSACEAGAPGPRGVAWAFARAGASAIAAPREAVADSAAAEWSRQFYAALARGETFAQAASEARAARFLVVK